MCGIAGRYSFSGQADEHIVQKMIDALQHRGPDGQGLWKNSYGSTVLGHRRLSIIDLMPGASQPMHYKNRFSITFNGEIYNYIELRDVLEKKGHQFLTQSDTEVILAAYDEFGTGMFQYFDGMFSFAIWDEQKKELLCARDRFGEKPFYYHTNSSSFSFASEMKAFFHTGVSNSMSDLMVYNLLVFDLMENPENASQTFYKDVKKLEPAHYLLIKADGSIKKEKYWELKRPYGELRISPEDAFEKFRELLTLSVSRRLRSDVPVGVCLSGGLDSSTITSTISNIRHANNSSIHTFSARFLNERLDEGPYIDYVVKKTGVQNHPVWVSEKDIETDLTRILYHQEEPISGLSAMAQYKVMKLAKEHGVTVLLDGQGADETQAGYVHFFNPFLRELYNTNHALYKKELESYKNLHKKDFDTGLRFIMEAKFPLLLKMMGATKRKLIKPNYQNFVSPSLLKRVNQQPPFHYFSDLNDALSYFTNSYGLEKLLRLSDRNSMANSREVRVPFLFHELVEFLFQLPSTMKMKDGWTKYIMRRSYEHLLPSEIAWRVKKLGFQPPQEEWINVPAIREMVKEAEQYLVKEDIIKPNSYREDKAWSYLELYILMTMKY